MTTRPCVVVFKEGVQEMAHPKAEPGLLLVRAAEATRLALTYRARGDYKRAAALANSLLDTHRTEYRP